MQGTDRVPTTTQALSEGPTSCVWPYEWFLSNGPVAAGEPDRHWWLIYTKSRQEKRVASSLDAMGVPHYLPLIKRHSLTRGRTRISEVPLFSGYVFVFGTEEDRILALKTNRVSTAHMVVDGERLRLDLQRIAELIEKGAPLTPEARLVPGQWVRVKSGPFVGMEGIVLKRRGRTRLLVAVDYLQQGASMEVDDFLLEPL